MSEFKLDFEQRAEAEKVSEEIEGDPDRYAYELVWSRAEIARLTAEVERVRAKCKEIIADMDGDANDDAYGWRKATEEILRALDGEP